MTATRRLSLYLGDQLTRAGITHYGVDEVDGVFHVMTYDASPYEVRAVLLTIDQLDWNKSAESLLWDMCFTLEGQS